MIAGTNEIAELFGVTTMAVGLWVKKGCPKIGRGQWDVKEVLDWWIVNIYQAPGGGAEADDESMLEAKRQYWTAKAEGERIKVEQTKGNLIPKKDIASEWSWRMAEVCNGLQSLAMRLPPLLEGKTPIQMREIIDKEQWSLRDIYCRTGRFCPAGTEEERGEEAKPEPKKRKKRSVKPKKKAKKGKGAAKNDH